MAMIYVNQKKVENKKIDWLEFVLETLVGALTLMIASSLFESFYVENIWYACLASIVIGGLNVSIKPLLIYLTLPVSIMTLGITYPFVNVIILKITSLILGSAFIVKGWFIPFFIAIFISVISKILEKLIVKPYKENK